MTEVQPPFQPQYMSAPVAVGAPAKPTSVLVLSIIGIILGGLSTLCSPLGAIGMLIDTGMPNPALDAMRRDALLMAWTWFSLIQGTLMGIVLLACSIGALLMKRWGRAGMVLYGIIQTTLTIAGLIANVVWFQPRMNAMQAQIGFTTPMWQQAIGWGMAGLALVYQVSVWYVFTRPRVVDAYDAAEKSAV